jgi:hypothetical protein
VEKQLPDTDYWYVRQMASSDPASERQFRLTFPLIGGASLTGYMTQEAAISNVERFTRPNRLMMFDAAQLEQARADPLVLTFGVTDLCAAMLRDADQYFRGPNDAGGELVIPFKNVVAIEVELVHKDLVGFRPADIFSGAERGAYA